MRIDSKIEVGDILTSISIMISAIALVISFSKDRNLQYKEQANRIREACAETIVKLERWKQLSFWIYTEAQPVYIKAGEMLASDSNVLETRDFLWKELHTVRIKVQKIIVDEKIETAYSKLYSYDPSIQAAFTSTMSKLVLAEGKMFDEFLNEIQIIVLSYKQTNKEQTVASLGNALRAIASRHRLNYQEKLNEIISSLTISLTELIQQSDNEIVFKTVFKPFKKAHL
jgi:hypothetical protein